MSSFMVVTPSFTHLSITFSNQRFCSCRPVTSDNFVEICAAVIVRFFPNSSCQCTTISLCQCWFSPLFLFVEDVFPWFVYADITLETVALDTANNLALFVTDAPAKRAPTIYALSKSDKSPIFGFFHMDCHSTQSLMQWHKHYKV
jgi:hypothetical protein